MDLRPSPEEEMVGVIQALPEPQSLRLGQLPGRMYIGAISAP
jgi:hypothetical protein